MDSVLIDEGRLAARVEELAREIAEEYEDTDEGIIIVTILSGSIIFLADLIRHLPIKMRIGLITVSSYPGATTRSKGPRVTRELDIDVSDHHVLVVDDILDTGNTLRLVQKELRGHGAKSVRTAVLLRKASKAPPDVPADFIGFEIEDRFVVGYGLDYNDLYRNLPHIAVLKPSVFGEA